MISKQLKTALTEFESAKDTIDNINEIYEYPGYNWLKSVLNDVPIEVVSIAKMNDLLDEIKRRERIAIDNLLFAYRR